MKIYKYVLIIISVFLFAGLFTKQVNAQEERRAYLLGRFQISGHEGTQSCNNSGYLILGNPGVCAGDTRVQPGCIGLPDYLVEWWDPDNTSTPMGSTQSNQCFFNGISSIPRYQCSGDSCPIAGSDYIDWNGTRLHYDTINIRGRILNTDPNNPVLIQRMARVVTTDSDRICGPIDEFPFPGGLNQNSGILTGFNVYRHVGGTCRWNHTFFEQLNTAPTCNINLPSEAEAGQNVLINTNYTDNQRQTVRVNYNTSCGEFQQVNSVTIRARGIVANGDAPIMEVYVGVQDGTRERVHQSRISNSNFQNINVTINRIITTLDVVFPNDSDDRDLYIESVTFNMADGTSITQPTYSNNNSNNNPVVYDRGGFYAEWFDGIDTVGIGGSGGMYWNGALHFPVPWTMPNSTEDCNITANTRDVFGLNTSCQASVRVESSCNLDLNAPASINEEQTNTYNADISSPTFAALSSFTLTPIYGTGNVTFTNNTSNTAYTLTGVNGGTSTTFEGVAQMSNGSSCRAEATVQVIAIGPGSYPAWWQSTGGDVISGGRIYSEILDTTNNYLLGRNGSNNRSIGLPIYNDNIFPTFDSGQVAYPLSNTNDKTVDMDGLALTGLVSYNYTQLLEMIPSSIDIDVIEDTSISSDFFNDVPDDGEFHWYETRNFLSVTGATPINIDNKKVVIFVEGQLNLNTSVNIGNEGNLIIIANDNINISPTISSTEGVYFAQNDFNITSYGGLPQDNGFNLFGVAISARGEFDMRRDLDSARNETTPSEKFIFAPNTILNFPKDLTRRSIVGWREVAPNELP